MHSSGADRRSGVAPGGTSQVGVKEQTSEKSLRQFGSIPNQSTTKYSPPRLTPQGGLANGPVSAAPKKDNPPSKTN